jgi:hypothetical protein
LGFNKWCLAYQNTELIIYDHYEYSKNSQFIGETVAVPLWQQAIDWCDSKGFFIVVYHDKLFGYNWRITSNKNKILYNCIVTYQKLYDAYEIAILKSIELCKKQQETLDNKN